MFKLDDVLNQKAKTLSGGWQRKVSIAMALINDPKILFLDEPTLGLDVIARKELWSVIEKQKNKIQLYKIIIEKRKKGKSLFKLLRSENRFFKYLFDEEILV